MSKQHSPRHCIVVYRWNLVNMLKSVSLYSKGLRPLLYSNLAASHEGLGWHRACTNIRYFANSTASTSTQQRKADEGERATAGASSAGNYTLSFDVCFEHDDDTCYLAHCFPYTYTDLQRVLRSLQRADVAALHARMQTLPPSASTLASTSPLAMFEQGAAEVRAVALLPLMPPTAPKGWAPGPGLTSRWTAAGSGGGGGEGEEGGE